MSDTNVITVRGWVGTDPDVVITANGKEMTRFRLGSTRSYRDAATGEWRDTETEWFTVKAWGTAGQAVRQSLHRGMPVVVQGVFKSEQWESDDGRHHKSVITANVVAVDVKYGLVTYAKVTRLTPAENQGGQLPGATTPEDAQLDDAEDDAPLPVLAPDPVEPDAWEMAAVHV